MKKAEAQSNASNIQSTPPTAEKKAKVLTKHNDRRIDNYFWMRERENPQVTAYLNSENNYLKQVMAPTEGLQNKLFSELKARIKQEDSSAPYKKGSYKYWTQYQAGFEYPQFWRAPISSAAHQSTDKTNVSSNKLILDANELAKDHKYFSIGSLAVSTNENLIAYSTDTVGRRFYDLKFKSISDNKILSDEIKNTTGNAVWLSDNKTILYSKQDPETLRSYQIYRYTLGRGKSELVYEEKDPQYYVSVQKSLTLNEVYINCRSNDSTETLVSKNLSVDVKPEDLQFKIIIKRTPQHEYAVADGDDRYYVLTNYKAKNFRVIEVLKSVFDKTEDLKNIFSKNNFSEVVAHDPKSLIDDMIVFKNFLVFQERSGGLIKLSYMSRTDISSKTKLPSKTSTAKPRAKTLKIELKFPDPNYVAGLGHNAEYDTDSFRYDYQSLTAPETVYDYNFKDKKTTSIKVDDVPTYDSSKYKSERVWAKAKDGAKIPISIVYKK
ncbi:MAG: hypothetical protein ABL927_04490, partial [Bdellovibrionales bacterium]